MSSPPYTLGWVHNLDEAPATSDAGVVIVLAAAFSSVAVVFTVLRLSMRWKIVGSIGLDDAAIAASAVSLPFVALRCGRTPEADVYDSF